MPLLPLVVRSASRITTGHDWSFPGWVDILCCPCRLVTSLCVAKKEALPDSRIFVLISNVPLVDAGLVLIHPN
ncbi:hypothetical protein ACOSQ2_020654 [Xanthoceras sorbifolium]